MSDPSVAKRLRASAPLSGAPVIRRGGHWWLVTGAGSLLATDPVFTGELNRFAAARAAADREVARLRATDAGTAR
ncbi:hypothetical protein ACGF0D_40065 [Kitasatospora sp. NPDC048298]|uniref:hypothetical protein n=1 Tax=Kitasatospora sp. NPDC048298 TaxID=3364049 RepID=UPI0037158D0A